MGMQSFLAKRDQNKWKKKLNTDVCGRRIRASSAPRSASNVDEVKAESKIERGRPFDFWGGGGGGCLISENDIRQTDFEGKKLLQENTWLEKNLVPLYV